MTRRWVLALVLLMAACSEDDGSAADTSTTRPPATEASSSTAPSTTATTEPADPFAVPDPITEDYVQRVLEAHEEVVAEAGRLAREANAVTPEIQAMFRSIRADAYAQASIDDLASFVERGFPNIRTDRGPSTVTLLNVSAATDQCIGLRARYTDELVLIEPGAPVEVLIELRPVPDGRDPLGHNPTHWLQEFQFIADHEGIPEPCAS